MKREEEYIIDESREIAIGENPLIRNFFNAFPALSYTNYRWYFIGQLISLTGTWLQIVALGWLVLELTHSAFWVGAVSAIGAFPAIVLSLFGGVIIDRFDKKKILYITQLLSFTFAFTLGILTVFHWVSLESVIVLSFLLGAVSAVDLPTRQAFTIQMVGKEGLTSAIALNSGIFNGARVLGPGVAGLLIASFGTGGAFLLNGLSFLIVVISLFYIHVESMLPKVHPHPITAIKEGLTYAYHHRSIRLLLMFSSVVSIFGWSYGTVLPVMVAQVFHKGAAELGYMYAAAGVGALLGTILVSVYSKKVSLLVFILGGNTIFSVFMFFFTFMTSVTPAYILLFFSGFGIIMQFATMNSAIQHSVADHVRGRVMSLYTLTFLGMAPLGSFIMGVIAEHFGSPLAIRLGVIVVFLFGGYVYTQRKHLIEEK